MSELKLERVKEKEKEKKKEIRKYRKIEYGELTYQKITNVMAYFEL